MKKKQSVSVNLFILGSILIIGLIFRLYKINTPLADLHSWRQADTASVARNFVEKKFDLFHPRYDDLSNIQSGIENPEGYRFVEFPIYNALMAVLKQAYPPLPIHIYGRLVSIFFSLLIIATIYLLVLKETGRLAAFFSSLTFAVFPFFVFFSRTVLPGTTALGFTFLSLLIFYLGLTKKSNFIKFIFITIAAISFALGLLVKPMVIFYSLAFLTLFYRKDKTRFFSDPLFYCFFIISFLPLVLWRIYISQFSAGVPVNHWLFYEVNSDGRLKNIFLRPSFFRWIFFKRINEMILGGYLTFFFILGVLKKQKKILLFSILLSAFIFLFTFQGGNVQHEYYQIIILPALAIYVGLGANHLLTIKKNYQPKFILILTTISIYLLSFYFSFYQVKNFYNYPHDLPKIANIINTLTAKNDKIITDTVGDTTLLYLAHRRGAPAPYKDFASLKKEGYRYFVTMKKDVIRGMKASKKYQLIFQNNKLAIFKL